MSETYYRRKLARPGIPGDEPEFAGAAGDAADNLPASAPAHADETAEAQPEEVDPPPPPEADAVAATDAGEAPAPGSYFEDPDQEICPAVTELLGLAVAEPTDVLAEALATASQVVLPPYSGNLSAFVAAVMATDAPDWEPDWDNRDQAPADEPPFMYVAGTAGTGKTYLMRLRATNYTDAMLCATTGIAAVNLGGTTINSVLRYYDTSSLQTEYEFGRLGVALKQMANSGFTRLIVDEVSMMDGRQLDIIMLAVDELNEKLISEHKKSLGITLVGDFAQLPPVKAPFVFERPSWQRFEPYTVMLTEPRRQADPEFVRALQAVRRGDQTAVDYFRPFIQKAEIPDFDGSNILATNAEVDRVNKVRMLKLAGPETSFRTVRSGKQSPEWKIIPEYLILKPNALVMVLANKHDPDTKELTYANGDLGHYLGPLVENNQDSPARCKLIRNGAEVVVQRVAREYGKPTGARGVKKDRVAVEGSISYMPLRVAYGTTAYKSQGLSLDQVQLMINSQFWMQPSMLYVALSRARTPQGLHIIGSPEQFRARIRCSQHVARWL